MYEWQYGNYNEEETWQNEEVCCNDGQQSRDTQYYMAVNDVVKANIVRINETVHELSNMNNTTSKTTLSPFGVNTSHLFQIVEFCQLTLNLNI